MVPGHTENQKVATIPFPVRFGSGKRALLYPFHARTANTYILGKDAGASRSLAEHLDAHQWKANQVEKVSKRLPNRLGALFFVATKTHWANKEEAATRKTERRIPQKLCFGPVDSATPYDCLGCFQAVSRENRLQVAFFKFQEVVGRQNLFSILVDEVQAAKEVRYNKGILICPYIFSYSSYTFETTRKLKTFEPLRFSFTNDETFSLRLSTMYFFAR